MYSLVTLLFGNWTGLVYIVKGFVPLSNRSPLHGNLKVIFRGFWKMEKIQNQRMREWREWGEREREREVWVPVFCETKHQGSDGAFEYVHQQQPPLPRKVVLLFSSRPPFPCYSSFLLENFSRKSPHPCSILMPSPFRLPSSTFSLFNIHHLSP